MFSSRHEILSVTASISFHVGRDQQRGPILLQYFQIRLRGLVNADHLLEDSTIAPMRSICANASTVRFCADSFDGLTILGLPFAVVSGQLAGFEIRMLLQNPQRIATRDRCVLAGVARQNDACFPRQVK